MKVTAILLAACLAAFAAPASIEGLYKNANGSTVEVKKGKYEYDFDIKFLFKSGECEIEHFWNYKNGMKKKNTFLVQDNLGYGMLLFYEAKFDGNGGMDMTASSKFVTDSGCEYGMDKKISGKYKKVK